MSPWRALYPVIMLVGLGLSYWALRRRYAKSPLDEEQRTAIGLAAFMGAMLGAKAPFLLSAGTLLTTSWTWLGDGKTILGGIFGGYLAVELTKWFMKIRVRTGDHFAVPVAMAVATGRLGCFVSGCCFGVATQLPWGISFPTSGDLLPRHPTQLYEFAFHATAVAILLVLEGRNLWVGYRLSLYLSSYLVYRFLTEWIRPEPHGWWGLTAYQWACLGLLVLLLYANLRQPSSQSAGSPAPPLNDPDSP
ncbi:prolipoprotein diacylglyceryl transferase [Aureliella helgolandensis]|uniref:Prolipoprotein diacylglyceryl transferase n=1 Tax=Aureliella helgolandensis TaxID=2527968 RepID=A0A518GHK2_9BACT|nr:prolipoprotein diacylglyceryl transferase family protein [Aureliella helgolandensis]QDV28082.1 Prolipoprotein diacylglyceryl transferase [Aureliella helgolandensis]